MDSKQLEYLLALWHIPKIGPAIQTSILDAYPLLEAFFKLSTRELKSIGFNESLIQAIKKPPWHQVEKILNWAEQANHHLITFFDSSYPALLKETVGAPMIVLAHGDANLLHYSQLAMVGSRNPTTAGRQIAKSYGAHLAQQGLVITSGLAMGIDAMAHEGALAVKGKTIAVLGTGIDVTYPKINEKLHETIAENGLLLSEFPPGLKAHASNFPRRNRIISGLSLGTFVVEAALQSGSLITARYALEQGRDIFTMPSSIHNPMAKGCHWLLKQGANLVETVDDIWQHFSKTPLKLTKDGMNPEQCLDFKAKDPHMVKKLTKQQQQLLHAIGFDRIGMDLLQQRTGQNVEQLCVLLLELELAGYVESVPGGYQRIT